MKHNIPDDILLEVRNLSVTLGNQSIFSGLNFNIRDGEFLTVMGPNGSGKTVLVKSLLGFIPHEGDLIWHRHPKIGYLPQGLNQMSVQIMPLTVHDFFRIKNIKTGEAVRYLTRVGLDQSILDKGAGNLSSGEFQRMLLAWILSSGPELVFLDEPVTGIDVAGGETIYSLLHEYREKHNLTIVQVTHDLNIVNAFSTHVLCLSRVGHRCYGVPKEILTPEVLHDIYGTDIKFYKHDHDEMKNP